MKPVVPKTVSVGNKVHGTSSDQWKTTWSASHGFCCSCPTQCYSFPALNHRETKETAEKWCKNQRVWRTMICWKMTWVAKWMLHTLSLKGHWFKNIDLGTFRSISLHDDQILSISRIRWTTFGLCFYCFTTTIDNALYKKDAMDVIFIIRANVIASLFCNLEWPLLFRHSLSFMYSTVNKPDLTKTKAHTFATRHKTIHINLQFTKHRKSKDVDIIVGAEI